MSHRNDPNDDPALGALTKLARDTVPRPTSAQLDRGLSLIVARGKVNSARRTKWRRWSLAALMTALCMLLGFQVASLLRRRTGEALPLAYRVEGGSVLAGGYLRDAGDDGVRLVFNEGTRVELMPGARGRLRQLDQEGTRVVLDQGTASFDVARSRERRWLVDAGPFSVAVKGTFFTVSWDPASERFELILRHGSVVVSGPIASGDIQLRAGQRLLVSLPKAETLITEDPPDAPAAASSPAPAPAALDRELAGGGSSAAPSSAAPARLTPPAAEREASDTTSLDPAHSWAQYLSLGRWDHILEEAAQKGIERTLDTASNDDLFALADAARYRRRTDLARRALLAQRRRFSTSPRSLDATFLLGRVEEAHDRAQAVDWYEEYLKRAPGGAYAAEALGRRMALTSELEGKESARPIAEEYLRRFPKGSYAGAARALCGKP